MLWVAAGFSAWAAPPPLGLASIPGTVVNVVDGDNVGEYQVRTKHASTTKKGTLGK